MITSSPEETIAFGRQLAATLKPGSVIALHGELGAGKTCLVKGIAAGLGISRDITSPTFTLIHEYQGGRLPLVHVDLYRLNTVAEAEQIGLDEYLSRPAVTVIEWAEKIAALLPPHTLHVHLEVSGEHTRRITLS